MYKRLLLMAWALRIAQQYAVVQIREGKQQEQPAMHKKCRLFVVLRVAFSVETYVKCMAMLFCVLHIDRAASFCISYPNRGMLLFPILAERFT